MLSLKGGCSCVLIRLLLFFIIIIRASAVFCAITGEANNREGGPETSVLRFRRGQRDVGQVRSRAGAAGGEGECVDEPVMAVKRPSV